MTRTPPPYSLEDLPDQVREALSRPKVGPCGLLDDDDGRDEMGRPSPQGGAPDPAARVADFGDPAPS